MPQSSPEEFKTAADTDLADTLYTRRGILRRSFLGVTAVGITGFLAACGGGDDDDNPVEDGGGPAGGDSDPEESSDIEEETGVEGEDADEED
ncbi:MAG TPA: hypothetical protein VD789_03450 [Thermomicrobiales bacterium]|nr:hypothetical protein [Thermomicrobiales bacterium]